MSARPRVLVLCALLALPTLLVGPALLPGKAFLPADLLVQFEPWKSQLADTPEAHWDALVWDGIAQYYPWRAFAAETLREGHLPLWNPYQFCGTPFLANGQSAVLYPLNLLFWALPVSVAFGWSAWLQLALTGWFAYLFLRRAGAGRPGAVAGAVVWQANSFTVAWIHLPTTLCTVAWLPLILLLCERAVATGRASYAVWGGIALGLSYLGGHPQVFLFVALMTGADVVARLVGGRRGGGQAAEERSGHTRPTGWRRLMVALIVPVVGLGLAAGQLLPTLELLPAAHRTFTLGPESYAAFLKRAVQPLQLASFLLPHPLGHPGEGTYVGLENYADFTLYLGVIALGLALWGAVCSRAWEARFLIAAAVVAMLVATGTAVNWPLYHWLPGFARAGGPARISLLAIFSLSMLAGLGVEALTRMERVAPRVGLAALLALLAAGAWAWWHWFGRDLGELHAGLPLLLKTEVRRALTLVAATLLALFALRGRGRVALPLALIVLLGMDLALAARGHVHVTPRDWVYARSADPGPVAGRVVGNAADWPARRFPNAVLPPNAAMVYHLRDVGGYDSLYLARYRDFAALIQGGDPSPAFNGNMLLPRLSRVYDLDMTRLAGVEAILSPTRVEGAPLDRVGGYYRYGPLGAWPRAWVAQSAVFVPDWQAAQEAMVRLGALPDCVIITGPDQPVETPRPGLAPTAEVTDLSPNAVRVDLPRGGGGYLFLADTFAPGWRAYAEGRELPVRTAYLTFRAVPLPREVSRVEFRYQPASFRVGLFIGLLTLAAAVCALTAERVGGNG